MPAASWSEKVSQEHWCGPSSPLWTSVQGLQGWTRSSNASPPYSSSSPGTSWGWTYQPASPKSVGTRCNLNREEILSQKIRCSCWRYGDWVNPTAGIWWFSVSNNWKMTFWSPSHFHFQFTLINFRWSDSVKTIGTNLSLKTSAYTSHWTAAQGILLRQVDQNMNFEHL